MKSFFEKILIGFLAIIMVCGAIPIFNVNVIANAIQAPITELPKGADPDDYDVSKEYRYRDKQTKSSTATTLEGWILYDTSISYGSWGNTQTTNSKPTESETLKIVNTTTKYKYYHYWNYYGGENCIDSIPYGTNNSYCEIYLTYQLTAVSMADQGGQQAYGSYSCGTDKFNYWFYGGTVKTYSYQTRVKTTTNYFYKFSEWSDWSLTPVNATDNRQVETRNVYTMKDHKHASSEWIVNKKATANEPGSKRKECKECGEVLETATIPQLKPSIPKLSKVVNTTSGVKFSWKKVSGADKYIVYRKTKKSGWKNLGATTSTAFTDKNVSNGTVYYYTVKAQNEAGYSGYVKSGISIKFVATPKLTKISNTTTGVSVSWSKVGGSDGYYVYRKLSGASKWTKISTIKKNSTTSFKDKTVKSGKTYLYTVKAYDGKTTSSYYSDGIKILYLTSPKISSTKNVSTGVKISWNKIPGAKGYIVYRKTSKSSWSQVGKTTGNSSVSFTDNKYTNNATYTYTVRAYNGSYKSSYRVLDVAKIKAVIKGDITQSNVKSKFLPILRNIATAENGYYKTAGFVTNNDGTWKSYYGAVPTTLPEGAVLNIYKFKSVNTIEELKEIFSKYMSKRFMEENLHFNDGFLVEYGGGLYVVEGAKGTILYDTSSIKLVGRYGSGYYVSADLYGSGDNYYSTVTFYVKKASDSYVVDKVVGEKTLHDWKYQSPKYDPVW